ncbi:heterokaryon incompatibility protein (TOL) [Colletotrichum tofieldiae]|uniref:Heterokaryon incompatibility protein (TOL) n=1 Tax=Colletotrichum tofieldiae TaxID=708197 RepID=A0A161WHM2_9PEZI|nr:heterokaryon incompatibility protein (TOL) [Colletotrichum tofieldiae]
MGVCSFCQRNVLESKKLWGYHHSDFVNFEVAAGSNCVFCAKLSHATEGSKSWFDHANGIPALYRWSMREAARMRDTSSYVSITFRPVPGRKNGEALSEDLPELRFDMFPEEDLGFIPDDTCLGTGTESEESVKQMAEWLRKCAASHPNCTRHHSSRDFIPTRVLDVSTGKTWPPRHVRVVQTKKEGVTGPYMTLSHCWGPDSNGKFVRLTDENLKEFTTTGIPWKTVSHLQDICTNANFAQALQITWQLGVRYIWVDSVCIIQGNKKDWDVESKLMHKVYRNSTCNLAAAVSKDHTGGLFRQRRLAGALSEDQTDGLFQKRRRVPAVIPTRYAPKGVSPRFGDRSWRILASDLWDKDLLGCHLYTRGWVFQERMLSPRLLQFGRDQIFWDCATVSACEILPDGLPASLDTRAGVDRYWRQRLQDAAIMVRPLVDTSEGSLEKFWENAVRTYTACDLTNPCDRDDAMWGIAKLVRDALGEEYAYGLWSTRVEEQLAWRVADPATSSCPDVSKKGFPSWSWTRLRGTILVPPRIHDPPRFYRVVSPKGGDVEFQFERALWGRVEGEHKKLWRQEIPNMDVKLADSNSKRSEGQVTKVESPARGDRPNPDKASVLRSKKIALRGHICAGAIRSVSEGVRWEFAIGDSGHRQVVFAAHPDVAPSEVETPCDFLLLAASRHFIDCWGRGLRNRDYLEDDDIIDEQHFGVGILVKRDGDDLRRVGAVSFRDVCKEDWNHFRRACGQNEKALRDDLDAGTGEEVWLI